MHMQFDFEQGDEVVTRDGKTLGFVVKLHQRTTNINILEKLFPYYMQTFDETRGDDFFVPTAYIDKRLDGKIHLRLTLQEALEETLTREPMFVAHGDGVEVDLGLK